VTDEARGSSVAAAKVVRCSICGTRVREGDDVTSCPECTQDYHRGCWDEIGGCATYGCGKAAVAEKPAVPSVVSGGWGDEKECPACESTISASLLVCRCGARFPWADPMTAKEYEGWIRRTKAASSAQNLLTILFVASLTGFPAPICGPIAAIYAWKKRDQLAGAHGVYLAIGYGSAALGAAYLGTMVAVAFAW
jgi:hypothetical protein